MRRRELLVAGGATLLSLSAFRFGWTAPADKKKQKVLYFTRNVGYEHSVVHRKGNELSFSEKVLTEMGARAGFDVECTKDGTVFDGGLDQYDLIAFYTNGDLTKPDGQHTPPMTSAGKQKLLAAIAAGKGFVGIHPTTNSFAGPGLDPFTAMIGGEFSGHGDQQKAKLAITSPKFPGISDLHAKDDLEFVEEWYTHRKLADDLHVILLLETEQMKGSPYKRPRLPYTWARMQQKGRVFFTAFGHREDIWTNPQVQTVMLGGIAWAMGNVQADVTPNMAKVAPNANQA